MKILNSFLKRIKGLLSSDLEVQCETTDKAISERTARIRQAVEKTFSLQIMGDDADWIEWASPGARYYRCGSYWLEGMPNIQNITRFVAKLDDNFLSYSFLIKQVVSARLYEEARCGYIDDILISRNLPDDSWEALLFSIQFSREFVKNYKEVLDEQSSK